MGISTISLSGDCSVKSETFAIVSALNLSSEFSRILREWLSPDELAEINRRNSTPEYSGCCASHDFCDPNQAMVEALEVFGLDFHPRLCDLVNEAWGIVSRSGFQDAAARATK